MQQQSPTPATKPSKKLTTTKPAAGVQRVDTPKSHYYTINGKRVVGVTTALNALPKPLTNWAARTVATHVVDHWDEVAANLASGGRQPTINFLTALPDQTRDSAGDRGTHVHDIVFELAQDKPVDVPNDVLPYVRGALAYLDDWQPETVLAETVVASYTHMYCGTLDSIQDVPGLGRVLVDWKTSNGIYGNHALQLPAYRYAEVYLDADGNEHPMIEVEDTFILHIKPDDYDLIPITAGREQFEDFVRILETYRRVVQSDRAKKLIGQPLAKPGEVAA
ncbi:hypothetical protein JOF41_007300 [Saccharothrix coeruleofusca]|uniref:hypothetical protein n=1 Tax=Saccharothrix coeruleofusca TaxID=33919 RepID=UPI001AEA82E1|nr:hypothetical protein [Saccharothrix coeruleofusca]MBP2341046.1 hypothetical protein [Saccharothrix coeruleofusca]